MSDGKKQNIIYFTVEHIRNSIFSEMEFLKATDQFCQEGQVHLGWAAKHLENAIERLNMALLIEQRDK